MEKTPLFEKVLTANPVFYRTYSRRAKDKRETWIDVCKRTTEGLTKLGKLTQEESDLIYQQQKDLKALTSGRYLWVGGTEWSEQPDNFPGVYNCSSTAVDSWDAFALIMDVTMMGCGAGAMLEPKYIDQLPIIRNKLNLIISKEIGGKPKHERTDKTSKHDSSQLSMSLNGFSYFTNETKLIVGDSRKGWVDAYRMLLELSADPYYWDRGEEIDVLVDLSNVRPMGEKLKGFGGVANPALLPDMFINCAKVLNRAVGRKLNSLECCLLIDHAALAIVAGSIRRSAGIKQSCKEDDVFTTAKDNLWQQDEHGNWRIDPERDALRMSNHTRVFHQKPTKEEVLHAVNKQYYSGEGAIQWVGESVARANCDLPIDKKVIIDAYEKGTLAELIKKTVPEMDEKELEHRLQRYGLNPCVTGDAWVHTEYGPRQVKDMIGKQHGTYVNGELFSTTADGFFYSGTKPVVKLVTKEGFTLRLTKNHRLLKVKTQTQKKQYLDWVETENLQVGDCILLHNHRDITAWSGQGTEEEGWLIGNLVGDGSLVKTTRNDNNRALLRYWEETQDTMSQYAVSLLKTAVGYKPTKSEACYNKQLKHRVITSTGLAKLASQFGIIPGDKHLKPAIEETSYQFYQGFLRGFFDADGSVQGTQEKGVSVRLPQSNLETLQVVQRMLARLGIISTVYENRRPAGYRLLPDTERQLAEYYCQSQHELVISRDNLVYFQQIVGFADPVKAEKLTSILGNYKRNLYRERFAVTVASIESDGIEPVYDCTVPGPNCFDANGLVAHNCGEITMFNNFCNLGEIHLNQIDPHDEQAQYDAFKAASLSVASLLHHKFVPERYQYSREVDPIVGVSFTGLFDFFVNAFGLDWLKWWEAGRPDYYRLEKKNADGWLTVENASVYFKEQEQAFLSKWKGWVHDVIWEYCDRHGLRRPNRCTTCQPGGTKSLLTGASAGWHPPKAQRFIRRITFRRDDPVALACIDYGYNVIPSQSDKDENGHLLNDPYDPRCTEWLVEIPVEVSWANVPGADTIDIHNFSVLAQFDFYMQVQQHYTSHNTSATLEFRENEIEPLAERIYQAIRDDEGYISAALLARFDDLQTFPRLPFEPIDKETYDKLYTEMIARRKIDDFHEALMKYDFGDMFDQGPAGCDSDKCLIGTVQK